CSRRGCATESGYLPGQRTRPDCGVTPGRRDRVRQEIARRYPQTIRLAYDRMECGVEELVQSEVALHRLRRARRDRVDFAIAHCHAHGLYDRPRTRIGHALSIAGDFAAAR